MMESIKPPRACLAGLDKCSEDREDPGFQGSRKACSIEIGPGRDEMNLLIQEKLIDSEESYKEFHGGLQIIPGSFGRQP